ncbi:MAG: sialate O-acetylesterase [Armatimonadetes bacterium]|nr:sialate O-acetylesterase [Armatimonadota bacterium]
MIHNTVVANVIVLFAAFVFSAAAGFADVKPSGIFCDGAVLQQGTAVPVWGTASDAEEVTVKFQDQVVSARAAGGKWMVRLAPLKPGGPFAMTITGQNTVELRNILVGEVWLASGQSNMEWPLSMTTNAEKTIAASSDPMLRHFKVPVASLDAPASEMQAGAGPLRVWQESSPETVGNFSAVAYYFARDLRKALNVPVGIINSSLGGSMAQQWTSRENLMSCPELRYLIEQPPSFQQMPFEGKPCGIFNGMLAPIVPYAIKGAIWYQGESDVPVAHQYQTIFPTMIRCWRGTWKQGDFPFLFVQLAPFTKIQPEPHEDPWAELREAQRLTSLKVPMTAMAVITDCGDEEDIHPRAKEPAGARLALAARAIAYRQRITYQGPVYRSLRIEGDRAIISFDWADAGLEARGGELTGFAVAGADGKFLTAKAEILGSEVAVWSPDVPHPTAVRYGWSGYPVVNLFNKEGLPASPFRTDDFPMSTVRK